MAGSGNASPDTGTFEQQRRSFDRATLLVQMFYAVNLLWACWRLAQPTHWIGFSSLQPLWPLSWASGMEVADVALIVFVLNTGCAALAVFMPNVGVARCLAFGGVLLAGAFDNSFGKIGHSGHAWIWTAFFLMFLPWASSSVLAESRVLRQRFLQVFWTAQFAILFFYSMSGMLKLVPVPIQMLQGEASSIAPEALARHIASRSLQTSSQPLLSNFLIRHLAISWPLYLGALYLEATAVFIAFRPMLHRLWGAALALFHIGIGLSMDIWFVPPVFLATLFLFHSPFQPEQFSWRQAFRQLPALGWLWQLAVERRVPRRKLSLKYENAA